jgi:hypothetical protein
MAMENELTFGDEIPRGSELIEVRVSELTRLFNAIDPSPVGEKDLDTKIEEFIVSRAQLAPRAAQLALVVHADRLADPAHAAAARRGIHDFFRERSLSSRRRLSQLFRVGRTSLVIGLAFLTAAVIVGRLAEGAMSGNHAGVLIRESIVIGGWVAMWRPLEIFLYDWWPIVAERKLFDRLSTMPVRITFTGGTPSD